MNSIKMIGRLLGLGIVGLLLTGCIEQEVKIKLHADGSGTLVMKRYLSDMESGALMLGEEDTPTYDALTVVRNSIQNAEDEPARKVQIAEYAFSNLGKALPELENLIPLMPRFSIQQNELIVSMSHEMNEYHGFSSDSQSNSFYHLEIEFPVPPESETGWVEGNRVVWKADADRLKEFQKSDIGAGLFECSVPASSVQLDLTPRLVPIENAALKQLKEQKPPQLISELGITIPIVSTGHRWVEEGSNATLGIYLPVAPDRFPLCYEGLKIEQLIIDGQPVVSDLQSEASGVFSGFDPYGREAPGIPIRLKFGWDTPMLQSIDRIDVSMQAAVPTQTSEHTLEVDAATATNAVLDLPVGSGKRIAVLDLDHCFSQTAKLKLVTNLNPTDLSMVYLDTNYGLRYPAKGIQWKLGNNIRSNDRALGERVFGKDAPFSIVEIHYPHIPTTSFRLVFVQVEELVLQELVLTEEQIHVD